MGIMSNIISFFLGILASVVGAYFFWWGTPEYKARQYNKRAKYFIKNIDDFLQKIILKKYSVLKKRLLKVTINNQEKIFPVISLINHKTRNNPITIQKYLSKKDDGNKVDDGFINILRATGRNIYPGVSIRLLKIKKDNKLKLGKSSYFKALSSCDKHFYYMVRTYPKRPKWFNRLMYYFLYFPLNWLKKLKEIINGNLTEISGALGVSVLTVIYNSEDTQYEYITVRNSDKKNGASDRHVVPSFMYEPVTEYKKDQEKEIDLEFQVLREFAEEIIGINEVQGITYEAVKANLLDIPPCGELYKLLKGSNNKKAELIITGLWLDILRLRPEISCVLIIRDQNYYNRYKKYFKGNAGEQERALRWDHVFDEKSYKFLLSNNETPMCPPGIAALIAGKKYCEENLKQLSKM